MPGPLRPNPGTGGYQQVPLYAPIQAPYQTPPPPAGFVDPEVPPVPPVPPMFWKRKEPIGALILIGFGLILLLNQLGLLAEHVIQVPLATGFYRLGVWLIVRRFEDTKGGQQ